MSREHEDFDSFSFLNYIIGGDYSSRLNMNLRQDKGYSYGFHSSISWVKTQSAWLARGSVQSEVTKESIIEIINEVSSARGEMPITEEEFHNAKDGILKSIPAQYATQRQIMGQVLELASFNLPDNYLDTKMKNIKELKISDIQGIAKRGIQSDNLTIVIVGDLSNIQPELSQLGIPIEVIDINDYLN
jgi:zinc protease